ncbi:MAG: hypothetical protein Q4F07_05920 [Bacteroidales bacterium]|nr:hypothetical protein [Bacteroidales bacterium]
MNIRKEKLDLFKAIYMALKPRLIDILSEEQLIILHLYIIEGKGLIEIAEHFHFSDYRIVKEKLKEIERKITIVA